MQLSCLMVEQSFTCLYTCMHVCIKMPLQYMSAFPSTANGCTFMCMVISFRHCLMCLLEKSVHVHIGVRSVVGVHCLRTAIATVLRGDSINGWLCHFGLKCSSFTCVNVGTSGRSACTPWGNLMYKSVQEANQLASRILDQQKYIRYWFLFFNTMLRHASCMIE